MQAIPGHAAINRGPLPKRVSRLSRRWRLHHRAATATGAIGTDRHHSAGTSAAATGGVLLPSNHPSLRGRGQVLWHASLPAEKWRHVHGQGEPLRRRRILHRIRETRSGELYDSRVKHRQRGEGIYAQTIERLFDTTARKVGMRMSLMDEAAPTPFRRPTRPSAQLSLF